MKCMTLLWLIYTQLSMSLQLSAVCRSPHSVGIDQIISFRVYAVIISKYATKIVGTEKRQVACVHGTQDQKQSSFNTFKPA